MGYKSCPALPGRKNQSSGRKEKGVGMRSQMRCALR